MPTDRYPWAGDAVERFEYEVRSQMHYVQEKFPLSLFIGHTQRRQAFFFVLREIEGRVGLVDLKFEEQLYRLMYEVLLKRRPAEDPCWGLAVHYDPAADEIQYRGLDGLGAMEDEERALEVQRVAREMGGLSPEN
ncbi:hypothetical protein NUW87_06010 [Corynebacterium pilbarense]|uniref:Uncharacterized protein n=1 Tax=Corynebacterium pilbarense TaxID=1288393 RepID=A0A9Q4NS72_9CORY|nr:hypothetical protein [Corynebacterium pilbarense]MCZ2220931.1 hypothetical protein [Corynebacterium pilbarense]